MPGSKCPSEDARTEERPAAAGAGSESLSGDLSGQAIFCGLHGVGTFRTEEVVDVLREQVRVVIIV